jgi:hypothetical protein
MNTKDLIVAELDQLPETLLSKVLESIRHLKESEQNKEPEQSIAKEQVWQAYLESEQENAEVYQRLATS